MPSKHAYLSPSSAARWINCPGSVKLSESFPPEPESEYAKEGTNAHLVAEHKLLKAKGAITPQKLAAACKKVGMDGEMDEATDFYADRVLEILAAAGDGAELMVEQLLDLGQWVPESFGTADAIVIADDVIEVIDLKYGKGVRVDATENPQLMLYGLGAAALFDGLFDIKTVRMTIVQPRLDYVYTYEIAYKDLVKWAEEVVAPRAKAAMSDEDPQYAAGDWCRWCPAIGACQTKAAAELKMARHSFRDPNLLDLDEIAEILKAADKFKEWLAAVEGYALAQVLEGEEVPGFKAVEGRSQRKVTDPDALVKAFEAEGFKEAMLYERKLLGITALEKLCGKKKFGTISKGCVERKPGKPTLAPESDKRAPINTAEAAAADFKEEE